MYRMSLRFLFVSALSGVGFACFAAEGETVAPVPAAAPAAVAPVPATKVAINFERDIQPLLESKC